MNQIRGSKLPNYRALFAQICQGVAKPCQCDPCLSILINPCPAFTSRFTFPILGLLPSGKLTWLLKIAID